MQKKHIQIIIPCYNERENIKVLYQAIETVFAENELKEKYTHSFIFVDDGSSDGSKTLLQELSSEHPNINFLSFSRNFGHQLAVKAGLDYATGDAVISMDADMQHPPQLIPVLLQKWEEGNQVVATLRSYPAEISKKKDKTSKYFYKLLNLISDVEIKEGSADFRLLDKSVVSIIKSMKESEPFLRGIIPWVGFNQIYIPYTAQARHSGETKYTLKKMLNLALAGATAFSVKPLYFAVYLGFIFSLLSLLYIPYVLYAFLSGTEISGWASLIMTVVFFGGIQLSILGILGIYLSKVFKQTKIRPEYIIQEHNLY